MRKVHNWNEKAKREEKRNQRIDDHIIWSQYDHTLISAIRILYVKTIIFKSDRLAIRKYNRQLLELIQFDWNQRDHQYKHQNNFRLKRQRLQIPKIKMKIFCFHWLSGRIIVLSISDHEFDSHISFYSSFSFFKLLKLMLSFVFSIIFVDYFSLLFHYKNYFLFFF
jgi:hypothetical protein